MNVNSGSVGLNGFKLTGTTTVKVIAVVGSEKSAVATKKFTSDENNVTLTSSSSVGGSIQFSDGTPVKDTYVVRKGTPLNLVATPDTSYEFSGWTGAGIADVFNPILNIKMDDDKTIHADFKKADDLPIVEAITKPTITPISGTKFVNSLTVNITSSNGTTIYYELEDDGKFTAGESFPITETTTVRAIVVKNGYDSDFAEATFTKISDIPDLPDPSIAKPTIYPSTGTTFGDNLTVNITNTNSGGGTIYYALGGAKFVLYSDPFTIYETTTVKAIAVKDGNKSHEAEATFTRTPQSTHTLVLNYGDGGGEYAHGTQAKVKPTVPPGYRFTEWTDDASGSDNPLYVVMDKTKTITANFTEIITTPDDIDLLHIDGGSFYRGNYKVTVSDFYMGETEVTNAQYKDVMGVTTVPSDFKGDANPVEHVSWKDAVRFCNELSRKENLTPYYTINNVSDVTIAGGIGYRLPTEAEWEYAAGGGATGRTTHAGTNDDNEILVYGVYNVGQDVLYASTAPVGSKKPNRLGLYDMSGNLWEWCWDYYHSEYPAEETIDHLGPTEGEYRSRRGGAWHNTPGGVAHRGLGTQSAVDNYFGFRVARSVLPPDVGGKGPGGGWLFKSGNKWYEVRENLTEGKSNNWDDAITVAKKPRGGQTDWRMPNKELLKAIYDVKGTLERKGFPRYTDSLWSLSENLSTNQVTTIFFTNGYEFDSDKSGGGISHHVLSVRSLDSIVGDKGPGGGWIFQDTRNGDWYETTEKLGMRNWDDAMALASAQQGGGFTNWELPNKEVLNEIYKAKGALEGKGFPVYDDWFWSSSQLSNYDAWDQSFGSGTQNDTYKTYSGSVLAVRAF